MYRKWSILLAGALLLASCVIDESGEDLKSEAAPPLADMRGATGSYEGEWVLDGRMGAGGPLRVQGELFEMPLPGEALAGYVASLGPDEGLLPDLASVPYSVWGTVQQMTCRLEGNSATTVYVSFTEVRNVFSEGVSLQVPGTVSFGISTGGQDYRVDLIGDRACTAMLDRSTGLWSVGIPVDRVAITGQQSGKRQVKELPQTVMLVYNAKKRVG